MESETEINIRGFLYCASIIEIQKGIICCIYPTRSSCLLVRWLMDRHINDSRKAYYYSVMHIKSQDTAKNYDHP